MASSGYLPDWAQDIALDAEANQEYERDLNRKRAALHKSVQADGLSTRLERFYTYKTPLI